jgi:predicted glutamine amidotransferase
MCRWIAYIGNSIYMDEIITKPSSSLVEQSMNAKMSYTKDGNILSTNGDGFGVGWYDEKLEPGLFKESDPAWASENLSEICSQINARIFMAHIRAASTGAVQRTNSHPFKYKNILFQHNGYLENFDKIRRDMHSELSDEFYNCIKGTTDSEAFFYLALTYGLAKDPKAAFEKSIKFLIKAYKKHKLKPEFNLSCAMSDGKSIYTIRYSINRRANSQFYSNDKNCLKNIYDSDMQMMSGVLIVSEPIDHGDDRWKEMPINSFSTIQSDEIKIEKLDI